MIDTIKISLTGQFNTDKIMSVLEQPNGYENNITGKFKNIRVTIKPLPDGKTCILIVEGSLPKLLFKDNLASLNFRDFRKGINYLSKEFGVDLTQGLIKRIHMSENIVLAHPVYKYYDVLCSYPRWERTTHAKGGFYFEARSTRKALLFYDKTEEMVRRRYIKKCPPELVELNIMRYECKIDSSPDNILKLCSQTKVKHIMTRTGYMAVINYWYSSFKKIKLKEVDSKKYEVETGTDLTKYLQLVGIEKLGYIKVMNIISKMFPGDQHKSQKRGAMRQKINKLISNEGIDEEEHSLTSELIKAIELIYDYHKRYCKIKSDV